MAFKPTTFALVTLWLALAPLPVRAQPSGNAAVAITSNAADLSDVERAIFAPNRPLMATLGSADIKLWNIASGRLVRTLTHEAYLNTAVFSPDGKWLIAAFRDGKVKLWNLTSDGPAASLPIAKSQGDMDHAVKSLWVAADNATLATGSEDGVIALWNIERREKLKSFKFGKTPEGVRSRVVALRLTADGKRVVAVSEATARTFDIATGKELSTLELPNKYPLWDSKDKSLFSRDSIISDDGLLVRYAAPGCDIEELRYLNLNDAKNPVTIDKPEDCKRPEDKGSLGELSLFAGPARPTLFIARSGAADLQEWDPKSRSVVRSIKSNGDSGELIGIDEAFKHAATRKNGSIFVRDLDGGTQVQELKSTIFAAESIAVARDGRSIMLEHDASAKEQERKQLTLWRIGALDPKSIDLLVDADATVADFAPAANIAIAVNSKGEIVLFSTETGRELRRFSVTGVKQPSRLRISPDGKLAAMLGENTDEQVTAVLIDTADGTIKQRYGGRDQRNGVIASTGSDDESDFVTAVAFSPDGARLAVGRFNGTAEIWDNRTMKRVKSLPASKKDSDQIWSLAFTADGRKLIAGSRNSGAFLWDVRTGGPARTYLYDSLAGHSHVASVAVSHDGSMVVGGLGQHAVSSGDTGPEHGIKVWNAATGKLRLTLRGQDGGIGGLAFSADDRWIISASYDGTVRYWNADTGRPAATFMMAQGGRWFVLMENGLFAENAGGGDLLNATRGFKTLPISKLRGQLHHPELIDAFLKGDPERRYAKAAKELDLRKIWDAAAPQN